MNNSDRAPATRPGVTRRRLVKTGAHAAWVIPTVTVIAAAPAFAVSGMLSVVVSGNKNSSNGLDINGTITNNDSASTAAFRVVLTVQGQYNISNSAVLVVPGGFTQTGQRVYNNNTAVEFTFTANNQLAGNSSIPFNASVSIGPEGANVQDFTVTLAADPGGAGTPGQASVRI